MAVCQFQKNDHHAVQSSVAEGVRPAAIYHHAMSGKYAKWLVKYANMVNDLTTQVTYMEKYRAIVAVEMMFLRQREQNKWTIATVGQTSEKHVSEINKRSSQQTLVTRYPRGPRHRNSGARDTIFLKWLDQYCLLNFL